MSYQQQPPYPPQPAVGGYGVAVGQGAVLRVSSDVVRCHPLVLPWNGRTRRRRLDTCPFKALLQSILTPVHYAATVLLPVTTDLLRVATLPSSTVVTLLRVLPPDNTHLNPPWDTRSSNNLNSSRVEEKIAAASQLAWPPFVAVSCAKRAANAVWNVSNAAKCAKASRPVYDLDDTIIPTHRVPDSRLG
ncbi:hypothetical protein ABOM_004373 [Aspergillus bombycis]|uniref:Uncharacterized protein n=1 Tax=Aspergillus bombycis TaxID=109264 RepID=A0A1F8A7H6_9EURO|nr:hypothetical protein ABOM_004373 [Aspergillus bombycis]OGM47674.1 hypothetical protein ABOM_004373 [Aspergillus bombycis]